MQELYETYASVRNNTTTRPLFSTIGVKKLNFIKIHVKNAILYGDRVATVFMTFMKKVEGHNDGTYHACTNKPCLFFKHAVMALGKMYHQPVIHRLQH